MMLEETKAMKYFNLILLLEATTFDEIDCQNTINTSIFLHQKQHENNKKQHPSHILVEPKKS